MKGYQRHFNPEQGTDEDFLHDDSVEIDNIIHEVEQQKVTQARRQQQVKRSIEDYMERKRLKEETYDPFLDEYVDDDS